jgi:hypothetical protein
MRAIEERYLLVKALSDPLEALSVRIDGPKTDQHKISGTPGQRSDSAIQCQ